LAQLLILYVPYQWSQELHGGVPAGCWPVSVDPPCHAARDRRGSGYLPAHIAPSSRPGPSSTPDSYRPWARSGTATTIPWRSRNAHPGRLRSSPHRVRPRSLTTHRRCPGLRGQAQLRGCRRIPGTMTLEVVLGYVAHNPDRGRTFHECFT